MARRGKIVHKFRVRGEDGLFAEFKVRMRKAEQSSEVTTFHVTDPKLNIDVKHESIDEVVKLAREAAKGSGKTEWEPVQIGIYVDGNLREDYDDPEDGQDDFGLSFKYAFFQFGQPASGDRVFRGVSDLAGSDPGGIRKASSLPSIGKNRTDHDRSYFYPNLEVFALIDGTEENLAKCIELCGRLRAVYDRLTTIIDQSVDLFGALGLTGFMDLKPIKKTWIEKILAKRDS